MERNSRCSSFVHMRNPTPPLLSRSVTSQNDNGDSGAESVLCAAICEALNQLFLCSGHSGDNLTVIPTLPIALDAGISSFRQRSAFVKEKVQDGRVCQKKAWNEWDSLSLNPCDYFLLGYMKDKVFVPPQPVSIHDLKNRITAGLLIRVWQELDYRLDVCRVTKGANNEHL